jgi:pilus assembly protein FimV
MAINKNKLMDAARKARDKGQVDKAIKEYLKIVKEDPKDVRVWLKIGDLYAKKGAKAEATETYLKVAKFYSEQGFYLKAVAVYKQILKLDPRLVEVNLKLAELYRQLGLLSDAMQHFEMVAAFFHREGKTKEALATIRQLVDLDPENVATRIKLAELYSKEGMVDDAVTEFGHACEYLKKHSRQDDFIKVAERLLWHKPENLELNRELATLYLRRGDSRRALQKLQTCFKANPRDVETLGLLAQAFQALDQKGKTVSVLKEMARVLVEAGKRREAEDVHRRILGFVPGDPDSKAFLGNQRSVRESAPPAPVAEQVLEPAPRRTAARPAVMNPTGSLPVVNLDDLDDDARQMLEELDAKPTEDLRRGNPLRRLAEDAGVHDFDVSEPSDLIAELALEDESFESGDSSVRGEANADEIAKILTETDVYVKYGLHQKAIDHLRKVFELDPYNLEARERLKDILLTQSRVAEAVVELLRMAEQIVPSDPDRAELYLRELLRVSPEDARAIDLAQRYRLDLIGADEVEILDEPGSAVGSGLLGGAGALRRAAGSGARPAQVEDELDFDDLDLDAAESVALDAPVTVDDREEFPRGEPRRPISRFESDGFEFELGGDDDDDESVLASDAHVRETRVVDPVDLGEGGETMEVQLDQVEEAVSIADLESDDLDFDAEPPGDPLSPSYVEALEEEDLPFDPADARRFDSEPVDDGYSDPNGYVSAESYEGYPAEEQGAPAHDQGYRDAAYGAGQAEGYREPVQGYGEPVQGYGEPVQGYGEPVQGYEQGYGPEQGYLPEQGYPHQGYGEPAYAEPEPPAPAYQRPTSAPGYRATPSPFQPPPIPRVLPDLVDDDEPAFDYLPTGSVTPIISAGPSEPTRQTQATGNTIETPVELDDPDSLDDEPRAGGGTTLEDDLDEADFFMGQGLWDEAREILNALLARFPHHPLVAAKMRDVDAMSIGGDQAAGEPPRAASEPADDGLGDPLSEAEFEPPPARKQVSAAAVATRPVVLLEKPIEDSDADTHYDLGLAYKEMGLFDEAIKAFQKVLTVPGREVQCHLMIGLCHKEQRNLSEAINQFKAGLYVDPITLAEKFGLYYEIGNAYEELEDPQEALYYYEMVLKKDPGYRDVSQRVVRIRASVGGNGTGGGAGKRQSTLDAETDSALDHLKR